MGAITQRRGGLLKVQSLNHFLKGEFECQGKNDAPGSGPMDGVEGPSLQPKDFRPTAKELKTILEKENRELELAHLKRSAGEGIALMNAVKAWQNHSYDYNAAKCAYKKSYANAYVEQSGAEAGKKTMAEAIVADEKKKLKDQQTTMDAAYFYMQVQFAFAGKQFVGPVFV